MPFFLGSGGNSVSISLSNKVCQPGSVLSGVVNIDIVKATQHAGAFLKIKGKESVTVIERQTHYRTVTRTSNGSTYTTTEAYTVKVPHHGNRQLFKAVIVLLPPGDVSMGQTAIPFSIQLPTNIPGSFSLSGLDCRGSIEYSAKMVMKIPGLLKSNLRDRLPFVVIKPPPTVAMSVKADSSPEVTALCCRGRGNVDMCIELEKHAVFTGETAFLSADLNNNSKSKLRRLTVKLRRSVVMTAADGFTVSLDQTVAKQKYPGMKPLMSLKELSMKVAIPFDTPQQCSAMFIQCDYSIQLAGKLRWASDVKCTAPILLFHPFVTAPVVPQLPKVWQPVLASPVVMTFAVPTYVAVHAPDDKLGGIAPLQASAPDVGGETSASERDEPITA
jgi:hypothetical protein